MVWMAAFHFSFDLNHFGLIARQDFYGDPLWTRQRVAIVSLFLFCAGLGQALALTAGGRAWPTRVRFGKRFWQRWALIAGCAVLVTIGSWFMFPRSFIYFGVLHGIAVMLVLARLVAPLGAALWWLALVALALPWVAANGVFDNPWLDWTGLHTRRPRTEDHVPLLPWFGVMCLGLAAGRWLVGHQPAWWLGTVRGPARGLAWLGRWSLSFYMLHQPILIGLLFAWTRITA